MARQSPSASCIVVEVVGARPCGQASLLWGSARTTSAALARCCRVRRHRDERHGESPRIGHEVAELDRLAGPREGEDHVVAGDHAEIAVARLARMHEGRRRAGGRERAGHLHADMAAFAHAGDDHPAGGDERRMASAKLSTSSLSRAASSARNPGFELNGARAEAIASRASYRKTVTFEADSHVPRSPAFPVPLLHSLGTNRAAGAAAILGGSG